jgi:hypothetical protein
MAYDSDRAKIVLHGGLDDHAALLGDTWEWDGEGWALAATSGPAPRSQHAMAYDAARARTFLFGGRSGFDLGDTWEWNGHDWTQIPASGPLGRSGHALAYDELRRSVILFGGYHVPETLDDTWEWNGEDWDVLDVTPPPRRKYHAMVYDGVTRAIILFGGWFFDHGPYDDTWVLPSPGVVHAPDADTAPAGLRSPLQPSVPHPLRGEGRIIFDLSRPGATQVALYDLRGRLVSALLNASLGAGHHELHWTGVDDTGRPLPSGVYFLRLESAGARLARKIVVERR